MKCIICRRTRSGVCASTLTCLSLFTCVLYAVMLLAFFFTVSYKNCPLVENVDFHLRDTQTLTQLY